MSKWYEVEVQTLMVYVVEMPDDHCEMHAQNVVLSDFDYCRRVTAKASPIPQSHIETARKNADRVRLIDGWKGSGLEDEDDIA